MAATTTGQYIVTVNYDMTLEEMIKSGRYDWSNSHINSKNFPLGIGEVEVNIELVHFDREIESDQVLWELDMMGLRPATLPELLAFGATYPGKQQEFPIVGLGSVFDHDDPFFYDHSVAYLSTHNMNSRRLDIERHGQGLPWRRSYRFAAVRNSL